MRKPNYRMERADRERAKKAKKEEKMNRQQERAGTGDDSSSEATVGEPPSQLDAG
jgi:hypothetical protein